jgi:sec-independent protein translocase protein TatA
MSPSLWQILIVVLVIFVLFGAGRLPRIMGDLAEGMKAFKKGMKDEEGEKKNVIDHEKEKEK